MRITYLPPSFGKLLLAALAGGAVLWLPLAALITIALYEGRLQIILR